MSETELKEKLKLIEKAMQESKGDPKKESQLLSEIVDPQDALMCDSCQ